MRRDTWIFCRILNPLPVFTISVTPRRCGVLIWIIESPVFGDSRPELIEHLQAYLRGDTHPGVTAGRAIRGRAPRLVFVFSGQGQDWFGAGTQLLQQEIVFATRWKRSTRRSVRLPAGRFWKRWPSRRRANARHRGGAADPVCDSGRAGCAVAILGDRAGCRRGSQCRRSGCRVRGRRD
jgi:hypothetical protein